MSAHAVSIFRVRLRREGPLSAQFDIWHLPHNPAPPRVRVTRTPPNRSLDLLAADRGFFTGVEIRCRQNLFGVLLRLLDFFIAALVVALAHGCIL